MLKNAYFLEKDTSNSVVFVDKGRKNISCPRAQGTLATSLPTLIPALC